MLGIKQHTIDINVYRSRFTDVKLIIPDFVKEYRRIHQAGVELFAEFNPCAPQDGTCSRGRLDPDASNFCCHGCQYLTDTGCSAEAIWCKLWTCYHVKEIVPQEFKDRINVLIREAGKLCCGIGGRYDLSDYIEELYGKEAMESWKITETSITSISSLSAS